MSSRMYEKTSSWNPFVGCKWSCIYCVPSFQRQAKRRKKYCTKCYYYEPHFHPDRLVKNKVPNTPQVFVCSMGDISFATFDQFKQIIEFISRFNDHRLFLIQTKNPGKILQWLNNGIVIPDNVIIGTTIETNKNCSHISNAPDPIERVINMNDIMYHKNNKRNIFVTIEPVMEFNYRIILNWIKNLSPEFVYIGYNSRPKEVSLPEPEFDKVEKLIWDLEQITEVRKKYPWV